VTSPVRFGIDDKFLESEKEGTALPVPVQDVGKMFSRAAQTAGGLLQGDPGGFCALD